jgi:hypothetical protein
MNSARSTLALLVALASTAGIAQPIVVEMPSREVLCHPVTGDVSNAESWQQAAQKVIERIRTSGTKRVGLLLPHSDGEISSDTAVTHAELCVSVLAPIQPAAPFVMRTLPARSGLAMICKDDTESLKGCGQTAKAALPADSRFADLPRKLALPEATESTQQLTDALFSSAIDVTLSLAEARLQLENMTSNELTSTTPKLRPFITDGREDAISAPVAAPTPRAVALFFPIEKKPTPPNPEHPTFGGAP